MTDNEKGIAIPENHQAHSLHIGELMPQAVVDATVAVLDKAEDVELGPLDIKFMLDDLADKGKFDWAIMPKVGSTSGNNPHLFKYTNDRNREVTGDAFVFAFMGTDKGKALAERLKDAELAASEKQSHQAKIYQDKVGNALFLQDEITMLKARIKAGGALWQKATAIQQKEVEFIEKIKPAACTLQYHEYEDAYGEKQMKRTKRPFVIGEPGKLGSYQRLPISSFIALDLDKAVANGGTFQAVKATLNKGTIAGKEKLKVKTVQEAYGYIEALADFFDVETKEGRIRLDVMNADFSKPENEHWLSVWGKLVISWDGPWTEHENPWRTLQKRMRDETRALNTPKATATAS